MTVQSFDELDQFSYSDKSGWTELSLTDTALLSHKNLPVAGYWYLPLDKSTNVSETTMNLAFLQLENNTATEAASHSEIERALKLYVITDESEVRKFLQEHQFLVPLLIDAKFAIEKHFNNSVVRLVVVQDREIRQRIILNALIEIDGSYSENKSSARNFDHGWWFNAMPRSKGKFSIDLI